jgi:CotH kinase protein/Secretion system C-terminal sorting domain
MKQITLLVPRAFLFLFLLNTISLEAQSFTDSNLPIIHLNTFSQPIYDGFKIQAEMTIYYQANGSRNYLTDQPHFLGYIGIDERGSSSSTMGKPCYGFETWDATNNAIDTSFIHFPKESDWILYASHNDKTFMRNVLTYDLYNRMGNYAVRTQHCELVINGNYVGVYVLMEKIKRDNNRVDIAKLTTTDTAGLDVTGGYIIKSDKTTGNGGGGFLSSVQNNTLGGYGFFQFDYPHDYAILPSQALYIEQYVDSFQQALYGPNFTDQLLGYRQYAKAITFIDYLIMNEVSKNPDSYALSTYIVKPKNNQGRKLEMGPPWDYDLAWKNSYYLGADTLGGYIYNQQVGRLSWWTRMMQDTSFQNELKCRWLYLRQNELSITRIHQYIDSMALYLNESQQRNFAVYPVLGQNVYYNSFPYPQTFQAEIDSLKSWVSRRITWLDTHLPGICASVSVEASAASAFTIRAYPNPFETEFTILLFSESSETVSLELKDLTGRAVAVMNSVAVLPGENKIRFESQQNLSSGIYFISVTRGDRVSTSQIIKW